MTEVLDGRTLTPAMVDAVAKGAPVRLCETAAIRMDATAAWVASTVPDGILRKKWSWLVGTEAPEGPHLIRAFVIGHCAAVGPPLPVDQVRATMVCRANVLATGATGARAVCAEHLINMLNAGITPIVPSQGSVGAAGDLSPLAHILRVAAGFGGKAQVGDRVLEACEALGDLRPLVVREKEALSMINGASLTAALGALAVIRGQRLLDTAEAACALSMEACRADLGCLSAAAMSSRHHPGPVSVAGRLRHRLEGSTMVGVGRKPDPFSIRCAPAVIGAARDAVDHIASVVGRELNAAADNPLVFPDNGGLVEAGNVHGAPVALAMDHLKVALTQVASLAERRIFRLTYGQLTGLPSFLVANTGLNSGLMLAQYTAASLVSECKVRSHPASVDSIPTVQHHEDHVSMGPIGARQALIIVDLLADVLAIELLCGAQALDLLASDTLKPGAGTASTYREMRRRVPMWERDRVLHRDIQAAGQAVRAGAFVGDGW